MYQIAQPRRDAAHVFLFAIAPDGNVILVRFLNATRDLPKQFPDDYDNDLPQR